MDRRYTSRKHEEDPYWVAAAKNYTTFSQIVSPESMARTRIFNWPLWGGLALLEYAALRKDAP